MSREPKSAICGLPGANSEKASPVETLLLGKLRDGLIYATAFLGS